MPTPPIGYPNVSASDVALPVYERLQSHLQGFLDADPVGDLDPVREWFRLPSAQALRSAQLPALAVIVDGLAEPPTWSARTGYTAVWDVTAAVYLRGADYDETRTRIERYVAAVRGSLLSAPAAVARRWKWSDEHYDNVTEASAARTLGAGYFALTVEVVGAAVPGLIGVEQSTPGEFTKSATTIRPRGNVADLLTP